MNKVYSDYIVSDGFVPKNVVYLILRECGCVKENIAFLSERVHELNESTFFIIKNPSGHDLWTEFKGVLDDSDAHYLIDNEGLFESLGLVYASDKYILYKNGKIEFIDIFGKASYDDFLKRI
ncbi:hypothetical protein [Roseivirga sp. E12]|uniref:hypothetical protein n=1 Tax=Roseivirga sp. E12 TaxID=2819237 RepID=UPI001ABD36BA|nr:hypothetical protein [Roseivirga sp. E12]MBO3700399.1 hypothetical protein [Roseivirga sp. E12]